MTPASRDDEEDEEDGYLSYADVLNAFADGKKHRLADLAAKMDLDSWGKTTLQGIASSLYRSGRLARLEPGVYRLARVEPPTAEVALSTESERMVDAAVTMLLALSPSERRAATIRAEREDAGSQVLHSSQVEVLATPDKVPPDEVQVPKPRPLRKDRLVDRVLVCYADGRPRKARDVIDEVCETGASRGEQRVVASTISKLKIDGRIVAVERGLHRRATDAEAPAPVRSTRRERSPGSVDPDDHEDWPLVEAVRAGDAKAEEAMLRKHEGILHTVCRRYRSDKVQYDDLMQEARLGFLHGLRKAEKGRGGNPITYSIFWVRSFVGRYFEDHSSDVRVPNHMHHGKKKAQSVDGLKLLHSVSMEQPLPGSEGERTYEDLLRAPPTAPDDDEVIETARSEMLRLDMRKLVDRLPAREAEVIRSRFLGEDEPTLDEVGAKLGLSRERVRQIQNDALARICRLRENPIASIMTNATSVPPASSPSNLSRRAKSRPITTRARPRAPHARPSPRLDDRTLGPLVTKPPGRA